MTTKIKTTLLTAVFFFGLLRGLQAQDKYHFARVAVIPSSDKQIVVITDNEPDKVIDIEKGLGYTGKIQALLKVISQMTSAGWEVINVKEGEGAIPYFLKKKAA